MELNDYHKQRIKKLLKIVKLQQQNPISYEEKVKQMKRILESGKKKVSNSKHS